MSKLVSLAVLPFAVIACAPLPAGPGGAPPSSGAPGMTDGQYQEAAVSGMHRALLEDIEAMHEAAVDLQSAAPAPPDRGWDAATDAQAIVAMRAAWVRARTAYEHIEGALAPLFPPIDNAIDARYDDFLSQLEAQGGDPDLFDDVGVTGMHAIERIVYADVTPPYVVSFEASLPGYVEAAFPATASEAARFKGKLCGKLVADIEQLEQQWTPANIDVAVAFQGLISLVNEQREKVQKAASSEEESRYAQRTMADLRDNLAGTRVVYALFQPWIRSKARPGDPARDGAALDAGIEQGFDALDAAYQAVPGDAIPAPPVTWSAESPSAADRMTPFGRLYAAVDRAVDPGLDGSTVSELTDAASLLGFPEFRSSR